jgi:hypothetical protein
MCRALILGILGYKMISLVEYTLGILGILALMMRKALMRQPSVYIDI